MHGLDSSRDRDTGPHGVQQSVTLKRRDLAVTVVKLKMISGKELGVKLNWHLKELLWGKMNSFTCRPAEDRSQTFKYDVEIALNVLVLTLDI